MSNILKTLAAGSVSGEYQISRSLRFNSADSAYLSRTPASAGSLTTWTYSFWWKPCAIGASSPKLFDVGGAYVNAQSDGTLYIEAVGGVLVTSQVFRDFSAWYHIVITANSTNATSSDRLRLYVNGVRVTAFATNNQPSLDATSSWNSAVEHNISRRIAAPSNSYIDGYLTEINFIDGQALTPSSFGETNETTGVWSPIAYAGSYGTNGFYLNFSDNSDVTAATLGKDDSGNGNNWTPSGSPGFSITAGAGNDSLVDTPTPYGDDTGAGGEVRGNYCTLNAVDKDPITTLSNGNLDMVASVLNWADARGTMAMTTGKWYFEVRRTGTQNIMAGVASSVATGTNSDPTHLYQSPTGYFYYSTGEKYNNNGISAYGAAIAQNDYIGVAFDADARTLVFYKNGVSQGTAYTVTSGFTYLPAVIVYSTTGSIEANFGQRPFAYTAPSGFKALVTTNLPEPTVVQGDDYFNTTLYTGDGTTNRTITTGLQSDFVWIKRRNDAFGHILFDVIRGAGKTLRSQSTDAESNDGSFYVQQFNSDNFLLGNSDNASNASGGTYVSWVWNAGGSNATNTDGTITSTVRANPTAGFSVVTFTSPTGTGNFSAGHGLGVMPEFVIVKSRDAAGVWYVYHKSLATDHYLRLNGTNASATGGVQWGAGMTSSVLGLRVSYSTVSGATTVAYAFAAIPGFSAFGSYTGNASTDGPFVYTGFRPAFILTKDASNGSFWWEMVDAKRTPINPASETLYANVADAVYTSGYDKDILSNGFKPRSGNAGHNGSGITYIYAAFAENPFKYSLGR